MDRLVSLSKMFGIIRYSFQKESFCMHTQIVSALQLPSQPVCLCDLENIHLSWYFS